MNRRTFRTPTNGSSHVEGGTRRCPARQNERRQILKTLFESVDQSLEFQDIQCRNPPNARLLSMSGIRSGERSAEIKECTLNLRERSL